jgi:hypothetical protein
MKRFVFLLVLLLSISLATAVTLETDTTEYTEGDVVTVTVAACTDTAIVQVFNAKTPVPDLVDMGSGSGEWTLEYNTNSDSSDGTYLLTASCEDGTTTTANFCVDSAGCLTPTVDDDPGGSSSSSSSSSSGSGGGSFCTSELDCTAWSLCNSSLQQSRTCTDLAGCTAQYTENRSCAACQESWTCSLWTACANDNQYRTCVDDHACGTTLSKPALQSACGASAIGGPAPGRISRTLPPPSTSAPATQEPTPGAFAKIWDEYALFIITIPLVLLLLIVLLIFFLHRKKGYKKGINHHELVDWIEKERNMGTSDEAIRMTLKQTTWHEDEIEQAFKLLGSPT